MTTNLEEIKAVTLGELCGGAAEELFQDKLDRVLRNIEDPNTSWKKPRSISITVSFLPNEDRDAVAIVMSSTCKTQESKAVISTIYVGRRNGKIMAIESNPKQQSLFNDEPGRPEVVAKTGA